VFAIKCEIINHNISPQHPSEGLIKYSTLHTKQANYQKMFGKLHLCIEITKRSPTNKKDIRGRFSSFLGHR